MQKQEDSLVNRLNKLKSDIEKSQQETMPVIDTSFGSNGEDEAAIGTT